VNKQQLIEKYTSLYGVGYAEGQQTNNQIAYQTILSALRNNDTVEQANYRIQWSLEFCPNQDRREIYKTFLEETSK